MAAPGVDDKLHVGDSSTWNQPKLWDHAAAAYDRAVGKASRSAAERLVTIAHERLPFDGTGCSAIDEGAGTGSLTLTLAQRFPKLPILATDISEGMLKQLETRAQQTLGTSGGGDGGDGRHTNNIRTRVLDMLHSTMADGGEAPGSYSHALSTFALQSLNDPDAALTQAFALLRPGGCAAMAIWDFEHECGPHSIWAEAAALADPAYVNPSLRPPGRWISPAELAAAMEASGFRDVEVEVCKCHFDVGGGSQGFMEFFWESGNPMPAERIRSYSGDLTEVKRAMEKVLKERYDDGKKIFLDTALAIGTKGHAT